MYFFDEFLTDKKNNQYLSNKQRQYHNTRYKMLLANVENGKLFKRGEKKLWICANCGFTCESVEAPVECPVCGHPRSFFAIKADNY